jgi:hypothetical protein
MTLNEYKKKVRLRHGNRFKIVDESFTRYKATVDIICKHGVRLTVKAPRLAETEGNHGHGCDECKAEFARGFTIAYKRKNFDLILQEIMDAHVGRPYTYKKAKSSFLQGLTYNLTITCAYHGDFTRHIFQQKIKGCPKCSKFSKNRDLLRYQHPRELIRDIQLIHSDYYDLSLIKTTGRIYSHDVPIICPQHGRKEVKIITLLRGGGCEACVKQQSALKGKRLLERMKSSPETRRKVSELICRVA